MTTESAEIVRNRRGTRLVHAATYLTTIGLLATGWWLALGQEGRPTFLARAFATPDVELHRLLGWGLATVLVVAAALAPRGAGAFLAETVRIDRDDIGWWRRWPQAVLTGRFAPHGGRFDPGQRLANIGFIVTISILVITGIGLGLVRGGPSFVWLSRFHRYANYALTPLAVGHIIVAIGVLPGYRGVWRAMHLGGRLPVFVARRLWPAWTEEQLTPRSERPPGRRRAGRRG